MEAIEFLTITEKAKWTRNAEKQQNINRIQMFYIIMLLPLNINNKYKYKYVIFIVTMERELLILLSFNGNNKS